MLEVFTNEAVLFHVSPFSSVLVSNVDRVARIFDRTITSCAELPLEGTGNSERELGLALAITNVVSVNGIGRIQRGR